MHGQVDSKSCWLVTPAGQALGLLTGWIQGLLQPLRSSQTGSIDILLPASKLPTECVPCERPFPHTGMAMAQLHGTVALPVTQASGVSALSHLDSTS